MVSPLCLAAGLALLFFYPAAINIAAGIPRMVFTAASILICFAFYKTSYRFKGLPDRALSTLGKTSYSIYLLHPLVWYTLFSFHFDLPTIALITICMVITLILSYILHKITVRIMPSTPVFAQSYKDTSGFIKK